ncbi:MAG: M48 family metallopeptidase [Pirellulaceae bacterium]|nr:M48 family metallopeptidase [Planctomycetales bacterium]
MSKQVKVKEVQPGDQFEFDFDAPGLAEAKQYGRYEVGCTLADRCIDLAFLASMAFLLARPLDRWLQQFSLLEPMWLRLIAMYVIVTLLHVAVSFPLSFFSGHVLEHKFGLSTQTWRGWLSRYVKRIGLLLVFGSLMMLVLFETIWLTHGWWWLVAAAGFFFVSIVLGRITPVVILPLFYKLTRLNDKELRSRMERLAEGTGLSIEGLYRMDMSKETTKVNAMLAGLGSTRRVIFGDTLLEKFSPDEIEVILAHEIGHHVHKHIVKLIGLGILFSAGGFWLVDRLLNAMAAGTLDYATLPVSMLPVVMFALTVFSQVVEPLQNMVSRHFERQSDHYALTRTRMPDVYRNAFGKLAWINKVDPCPHPLEVFLFHSHPAISERLAMADKVILE